MKITIVAGARPNFMKIAPIIKAFEEHSNESNNLSYRIVHTGQHYDPKMNDIFFEQLGIPKPHVYFNCGGGTDATQTACMMTAFENELIQHRPDMVIVVGDVNSTMACSIVTKKQHVCLVHVEAGLRSGDLTMPEEINRLVTDAIADIYFTTTIEAQSFLCKSGKDPKKVYFVGNVMIDTLVHEIHRAVPPKFWEQYRLDQKHYYLLTLHRPSNVTDRDKLIELLHTIDESSNEAKVIFPVHPRMATWLLEYQNHFTHIILVSPLGYLEFIYLLKHSIGVITDSGGITEEATYLGIPCVTLRAQTERPETVTIGTNELIGEDLAKLKTCLEMMYLGSWKKSSIPELWDGQAAHRIVSIIMHEFISSVV